MPMPRASTIVRIPTTTLRQKASTTPEAPRKNWMFSREASTGTSALGYAKRSSFEVTALLKMRYSGTAM